MTKPLHPSDKVIFDATPSEKRFNILKDVLFHGSVEIPLDFLFTHNVFRDLSIRRWCTYVGILVKLNYNPDPHFKSGLTLIFHTHEADVSKEVQ
jgi:hypothetical protein